MVQDPRGPELLFLKTRALQDVLLFRGGLPGRGISQTQALLILSDGADTPNIRKQSSCQEANGVRARAPLAAAADEPGWLEQYDLLRGPSFMVGLIVPDK